MTPHTVPLEARYLVEELTWQCLIVQVMKVKQIKIGVQSAKMSIVVLVVDRADQVLVLGMLGESISLFLGLHLALVALNKENLVARRLTHSSDIDRLVVNVRRAYRAIGGRRLEQVLLALLHLGRRATAIVVAVVASAQQKRRRVVVTVDIERTGRRLMTGRVTVGSVGVPKRKRRHAKRRLFGRRWRSGLGKRVTSGRD